MDVTGSYEQDGYAVVRNLIPPEVAQALLEQLERDVKARGLSFQSFARNHPLVRKHSVEITGHLYPSLLSFLWGLTPVVAQLTGRDVLPSYDFFRIYQQGDICRVHSDRPACEHSMTLTLHYSDAQVWDFAIGAHPVDGPQPLAEDFGSEEFRTVGMQPGDAILYQGVRRRHGRMAPNPNRFSAHLFLHWVDRDGPHKSHAFDAERVAEELARTGVAA